MNTRIATAVIAIAIGLSGCASTSSSMHSGVVYQDGSYYSPAEAGRGDYYYAPEPRADDYFGYDPFFFGSPFYAFGGYCSAAYRYCPPFWYSAFFDPRYDPFWPGHHYYQAPHSDHAPSQAPVADDALASNDGANGPKRPRPRWRDEQPVRGSQDPFPLHSREPAQRSGTSVAPRTRAGRGDGDRGRQD